MSYDEIPPPTIFLQFDLDALDAEIHETREEIRRVKRIVARQLHI